MPSQLKLTNRSQKFRDKVFQMIVRLLTSAHERGGYEEVLRYRKILASDVLIKHFMCSEEEANTILDAALEALNFQ